MAVEVVSFGVICAAKDAVSIVFNFIALKIIADFDDLVVTAMKNEGYKSLLKPKFTKKVLIISHTTSKKCPIEEESTEI